MAVERRIISVSRRTDVLAFYSHWFLERVREGFCEWVHPFNGRVQRVSLLPEHIAGIVFWTRYPAPVVPHLSELDRRGFTSYFHVTINNLGRVLERRNPSPVRAIAAFRSLADAVGAERVHWRYDPVVLSGETGAAFHLRNFEKLARELQGFTHRCYFSFLDLYGKTKRNLLRLERTGGLRVHDPDSSERIGLARALAEIARARGIELHACCEDLVTGAGIRKAHCVDAAAFRLTEATAAPTRNQCGCSASIDIGAYDTCRFDCAYCYATNSHAAASRRAAAHDPAGAALWRPSTHR